MPRRPLLILIACVAIVRPVAAQRTEPLPAIDSAAMWGAFTALAADSMEGRRTGARGGTAARALLIRRLEQAGLRPLGASFEHRFPVAGRDSSVREGINVLAYLPGADTSRVLVVSAHYDHVGVRSGAIYNGADDNASGTAALLAIAASFVAHPPRHSIVFAFFDGEEMGLLGARAFVGAPSVPLERIAANVNLDMIARLDKNELYAAGAAPWPFFRPLLEATAMQAPVTLRLGHDTDEKGPGENWTRQSDQGAFHAQGIPWVYFGVEDHPDYHRATDDADKVNPGRYIGAVRTIADFVRRLDASLDAVVPPRTR
ncbi:MAG: M28 family peptidase [Gemmatimonadota bacterium]|nr:M28 family peptidase [Gemmatimonadota bacterium]